MEKQMLNKLVRSIFISLDIGFPRQYSKVIPKKIEQAKLDFKEIAIY